MASTLALAGKGWHILLLKSSIVLFNAAKKTGHYAPNYARSLLYSLSYPKMFPHPPPPPWNKRNFHDILHREHLTQRLTSRVMSGTLVNICNKSNVLNSNENQAEL